MCKGIFLFGIIVSISVSSEGMAAKLRPWSVRHFSTGRSLVIVPKLAIVLKKDKPALMAPIQLKPSTFLPEKIDEPKKMKPEIAKMLAALNDKSKNEVIR